MSGNQKQTAAGGPQTQQRFTVPASSFPQIPQQQTRTDGYHVSTPTFVPPQQGNQTGSQGPALRGIAPTGPPNQASTPPNSDIKVQPVQQQSMNLFVNQNQVRTQQQQYYRPSPQNPSQTPRMPNRQGQQPPMFGQQASFMHMPIPPVYIAANPMHAQYYSTGQRPPFVQQTMPMYGHNTIPYTTYPAAPTPSSSVNYQNFNVYMARPSSQPQNNSVPPNPVQTSMPNIAMQQPVQQQTSYQRSHNKRRPKAIAIIDPDTGVDRLNEVLDQDNSHPPSGESSARQTPQPAPHNPNKEVQAAFAKQVAQAISTDENAQEEIIDPHPVDHLDDPQSHYKAVHNTHRIDVQSSNLKAQAKEFVSTAKESTPVVSAICDAVEVTLPNKQPKDRESPAKGRKQSTREHKDSIKDSFSNKDIVTSEKHASVVVKDDNVKQQKEVSAPITVSSGKDKDSISHQRDDKKSHQKKDSKSESKVPAVEPVESVPVAIAHPTHSLAQEGNVSSNAKSKQNASQRAKETQKQPQPQSNQKQNVVVPPPQPAKAHNKTSKKSELNQKGANKEGTDMDAFNDNLLSDAVNANVVNVNSNNDIINANAVSNSNNSTPLVPQNVTANDTKKTESNEVTTIKTEVKPFDITSIVKEPIKKIKPFNDSQDEPDRAALTNEKIVQVKNEANNKINDNDSPAVNKPNIFYKEGQWSPDNLDGSKKYDINFLMSLKDTGASKKKPENLPDVVVPDERGRNDGRFSVGGGRDYVNPPFYQGKSGSQRGLPQKRNSQSGKIGGGGGKGSKSNNVTKVSISLREDVKLNEVENAWKPARFKKGDNMSDEEKKTEELYKRVRGVLNKLTPQKFDTLISQVRCLPIDTVERLQGVIDLVFEKAVDEPNFSVAYANMCSELALMQVPTVNNTEENKEYVNFRKLLVTRCQMEFEKQSIDESVRELKIKEISNEPDAEKKKTLQDELDEYDRKLRMKSVGNIRFIGELFKQGMLTAKIMHRCLNNLIDSKEEEGLECLCKLLSTVGKELETKRNIDLSPIFNTMKEIVDKKHGKVNSRVRFMLLDAIDLRKNKWVPRRQDSNPKTIDQIQKEHETEQMNIQVMNSVPSTPRKDDRGNSGPNSDRKRGGRTATSEDGWITTRGSNRAGQFSVQSDKLKTKTPQMDEPLGSSHMFGSWTKGSNIKTIASNTVPANTANMYSPLENIESEKRSVGSKSSRDPYSSKGPSMERSFKQSYDGRGSRSGSQHRSNANSTPSSQRSTPAPVPNIPKPTAQQQPTAPPPVPVAELSSDKLERHVQNNLEEFLGESCSIEEYDYETRTHVPPSYFPKLVTDGYLHVVDRSSHARNKTGKLFASLIKLGTLPLEDYCIGLDNVLVQADDLAIDIPKIWDYLAEILVHLLCDEALPLSKLQLCLSKMKSNADKILKPLFKMVIAEKGPNFLQNCWQNSGLSLADFMPASEVDNFIASNDFGFLAGGQAPIGQSEFSYEQIESKLLTFFESKATFDDILNWIMANAGEHVKETKFIRTLATAIFKNSIKNESKLVSETLQSHYKLLQKFVDNNPTYELQCLYALQSLVHKILHPKGLLLAICNLLYDDGVFSQESFIAWEGCTDPKEQEGKGVALKQLTSFFTQLKENEDDDEEEEDDYASSSEDAA